MDRDQLFRELAEKEIAVLERRIKELREAIQDVPKKAVKPVNGHVNPNAKSTELPPQDKIKKFILTKLKEADRVLPELLQLIIRENNLILTSEEERRLRWRIGNGAKALIKEGAVKRIKNKYKLAK